MYILIVNGVFFSGAIDSGEKFELIITSYLRTLIFIGNCQAKHGNVCKFPFKWMNVVYENCASVDKADLGWCAIDVNPDGSFDSFEFCDGQCSTVPYNLVTVTPDGTDCCKEDEICSSVDIFPEVLGIAKIHFMDKPLTFVMNMQPNNGFFYKDDEEIEAIFRHFELEI